ncbi:MAG TPA: hypothetical protein VFP98_07965 [Candidatus Polarisedimenticolia bacterium]|nr:hypothetical protein [Candidatus Polarisedimenticolia bacterium]
MKRIHIMMLIFATAALLTAGAVRAQSSSDPAYVSGTITSSDSTRLVIRTDDGDMVTLTLDSQSVLPAALTPGARIDVKYITASDGALRAVEVRPVGAQPSGPESYSASATASGETTGTEALPQTASPLALIGLVGLASLITGAGLRRLSKRAV